MPETNVPTQDPEDTLRRMRLRLARERSARKQAEVLLEQKSQALYLANVALRRTADDLERRVAERTADVSEAMLRAQSANAAKSEFLALMSHEIRTPLNGVLGLSGLLQATPLDRLQAGYVHNLVNAGESLMTLINDILDFSKIEAGEMRLESLRFDPVKWLHETVALMEPKAQVRGVELQIELQGPLPLTFCNDPTRLRQVWLNLIDNALKFTPRGKVTVGLDCRNSTLRCSVQDTGIGMSAAVLERLFEPFRQADQSMTRKFGGTGLGLVISKALVEKMGGVLEVKSAEGRGSCFSFELPALAEDWAPEPLTVALASTGKAELRQPDQSLMAALRVLVVDDHPVNRLVTRGQLNELGCPAPLEASNGWLALERLQHEVFDVVLMDVQMPGMDGLETTRRLRQMTLQKQPRVIAITANAFADDRNACLASGMDGFVSKPVQMAALREALSA